MEIELAHHLYAVQGTSVVVPGVPSLTFTSLVPWIYCFIIYVAVHTSDVASRDQLSYTFLLIKEAQRHGGTGWLAYDQAFSNQLATDPTKWWNTLDRGLQASIILGAGTHTPTFCAHCFLATTVPSIFTPQLFQPSSSWDIASFKKKREAYACLWFSWNKGCCIFHGNCSFSHECATCHLNHKACNCLDALADSHYKHRLAPKQFHPASPPATQL